MRTATTSSRKRRFFPHGKSSVGRERIANDYYATDPSTTLALLEREEIIYPAWEPACGEGHISKLLTKGQVFSTDLIDRGYGQQLDFLTSGSWGIDHGIRTIMTNPPFGTLWLSFLKKALEQASHKVILFGRLTILEGQERGAYLEHSPLRTVYVFKKRQIPLRDGSPFDENGKRWTSAIAYAWYVWEKGYVGTPQIKWL